MTSGNDHVALDWGAAVSSLYSSLQQPDLTRLEARLCVWQLAREVASRIRLEFEAVDPSSILVVIVMRGGLMLYPAFAEAFPAAGIGLVQAQRSPGGSPVITYSCIPRLDRPSLVLYLDAVVGSGATILAVARLLRDKVQTAIQRACVISAAAVGTAELRREGITLSGISLFEASKEGLVLPDLGERDAGDLATEPLQMAVREFPIESFEAFHDTDADASTARRTLIYEPIISLVRALGPASILDLGCGAGELTSHLGQLAGEVVGYDPSTSAISMANMRATSGGVRFCDVISPEMTGKFDFIVCCMVLNVIENVGPLLKTARQCAALGGRQVWAVLHPAFQFNTSQWLARKRLRSTAPIMTYSAKPSYFDEHHFSKVVGDGLVVEYHRPLSRYTDILAQEGFRIEEILEPRLPPRLSFTAESLLPKILMLVTSMA